MTLKGLLIALCVIGASILLAVLLMIGAVCFEFWFGKALLIGVSIVIIGLVAIYCSQVYQDFTK